jgi:hypothetical protein
MSGEEQFSVFPRIFFPLKITKTRIHRKEITMLKTFPFFFSKYLVYSYVNV